MGIRREILREPTGSPVAKYDSTICRKISRERSSSCARLTRVEPMGTSIFITCVRLNLFAQICAPRLSLGQVSPCKPPLFHLRTVNRIGEIMRPSKRSPDEMRPVTFERGLLRHAEGSCLVKFGDTHVLVTATLEERLPPWLKGQGRGWVTAEYGMLPRATHERTRRESSAGKQSGRTLEIQRLIGRSLRTVTDLEALGERQITVDCDVIQADGGTRTASITGAWIALHDCIEWMKKRSMVKKNPLKDHVAAVSCGIFKGTPVLDLDYAEDSEADTDMNFVMTGQHGIVEIQGTAEKTPFSDAELAHLIA